MVLRTLDFKLVDVFADSPLRGNQLAVFLDSGNLSTEEMQEIAREMNFSETTFVLNSREDANSPEGFRTRIFTVEEELPFAGHPTLGTSFVLQDILGRKEITLSLKVGKVNVTFVPGEKGLYGEMVQPEPVFGRTHKREEMAEILRVRSDEIDDSIPVESVSTGNEFIIVPLKHLKTLEEIQPDFGLFSRFQYTVLEQPCRCRPCSRTCCRIFTAIEDHSCVQDSVLEEIQPDFGLMDRYIQEQGGHFFYLVCRETVDKNAILHARMIFYGGEDPATGSAAGPATAWLLKHGILEPGEQAFIEQGIEMKRPSRIYIQGTLNNGAPTKIRVGGYCFQVGSGQILQS